MTKYKLYLRLKANVLNHPKIFYNKLKKQKWLKFKKSGKKRLLLKENLLPRTCNYHHLVTLIGTLLHGTVSQNLLRNESNNIVTKCSNMKCKTTSSRCQLDDHNNAFGSADSSQTDLVNQLRWKQEQGFALADWEGSSSAPPMSRRTSVNLHNVFIPSSPC